MPGAASGSGAPGSGAAPGASGSSGNTPSGGGTDEPNECASGRIEARAVLASPRQYVNVLRDIVGMTAVSETDAAESGELVFDTVDLPRVTTSMLDRFMRLSDGAINSLRGKAPAFFGCSSLMTETCVRDALAKIGRRAYKRPLEPAELDGLMALRQSALMAGNTDQGESAALAALQAVLVSPSSLYRTEFTNKPAVGTRQLTVHERAAALAAFLLDSVPDAGLIAAADDGSLMTRAGLEREVDRLLALPRVRTHITQLVLYAFKVPRVFETPKDPKKFPEYTAALQNSMYEETRRFVEDILWTRKAPLSELLTSRRTFVDAALAKLYGVAAPRGMTFSQVELPPERSGILTHASVLSVLSRTDVNSVVARGLFVRGNVLCLPKIPGPPASVQAEVSMQLDAKASQRELSAYRAMTSPCLGCHLQFDRFGLLLEAFDPIGRYSAVNAEPVDFTGLKPLDGTVDAVTALAMRFEQDQLFERCFSDRTLSYALSVANDSKELCLGPGVAATKATTASIRDLVIAIADSPAFNTRSVEP